MDSDQDSVDDWVVLDSCTSSSDDERVLALSSGCTTPADSGSDSDSASSAKSKSRKLVLASAAAATAAADDAEGVYALSDAEDDDCFYPPPSPPFPRPLSGLFHHAPSLFPQQPLCVAYAAFDPAPAPAAGHHAAKQFVPDPTFSAFFSEPVAALASTRGLVCLRGERSRAYYVANPATFARAQLPTPHRDHAASGDPAVVIVFDLDADEDPASALCSAAALSYRAFYRHYHVVVAFPLGDGIYAFENFSSRTWGWTVGGGVAPAETVVAASGVGALGRAFWRTTMGFFLCYEPVSGCGDLVPAPQEVVQWPHWELGEMEGALCATCMDPQVSAVVVIQLDFARRDVYGGISWRLVGHFEGGCLRGRQDVSLLRSQGKAEVVMWDPRAEVVVAMDLEGRTTRTISFLRGGTKYYSDFIPYVSSLAEISCSGNGPPADCWIAATNGTGAEYSRAMSLGAETY